MLPGRVRRLPVLTCLLTVVLACAVPAGAGASGRAPAEVQRLEDDGLRDIIVARDPGLTATERGDLRSTAGVAHVSDLPIANTEVVRAPAGGLVAAIAALEAEPGVRYAEPNGPVRAATADRLWPQEWGLENTGQSVQTVAGTSGADIKAPQAWAQSTGAGQVVAVVDSGIAAGHEDLVGAVWTNPGEIAGNGVDDDHDGAVDDVHGWNSLAGNTTVTDTNGHGTHVTGTVAARKDNTVGIAGVAPSAQVFPLAALDAAGNGTDASIASAFNVAGNLGIPIVNASVEASVSNAVQQAIDAHPGTLFVLAAGNSGLDDDAAATPSLCHLPEANVICVGASDAKDAPATFPRATPPSATNFGATTVDLFAPGVNIASTYIPFAGCTTAPCYAFLDGTSMAAPHVSGTLALMRGLNPALTGAQLKARLLASVDPKAPLAGKSVTGGRLDAAAAVAASAPPTAASPAPAAASAAPAATAPPAAAAAAAPVFIPAIAATPVLGRPAIGAGALTASHALTIRFTLDRAAIVKLRISRGAKTVATVSLRGAKGANRYVLRTKVGARRLTRGRYRVRVRAQGAAAAYTLSVTVR
ncbi:MAG: serine protease [Solirubrobacteraceae bacterium]|nr:serine protease [Solirubrobacteraceae bacterium]